MKDWRFVGDTYICDLRVAGVLIKNGKILVQRDRHGNEYAIPGGHVKVGEIMTESLIREFKEETGAEITCERLLWSEECFWENSGRKVHNVSFYYLISFSPDFDIPDHGQFIPQKDNDSVLLGWIPIKEIEQLTIYPEFIKQTIHQLDAPRAHFITRA